MQDTKVILISAKAKHGKDATASILRSILEDDKKTVLIVHFADTLKLLAEKSYGWIPGDKGPIGRTILQNLGTDYRANNVNVWANIVHELAKACPEEYVLIPDCRYPNEAGVFKDMRHCVIRIERPGFDNGLTEEQKKHPSEVAMDDFEFDYVISNNQGISSLCNSVAQFYKLFLKNL